MIQVWKRKWEPTPGLSKRTSLTGNACFPIPQLNTSTYFYLLNLFLCFWISLKRCFLTSVKPLVVKDWNYTYDVSCNYRASNFYFWLIPTPKRSVQKSFTKGLLTSKGLLVKSKVCPAVLIACKHHPLSLNKRYLTYGGTFDFRTDLKTNFFI